jgi:hypothetical protein
MSIRLAFLAANPIDTNRLRLDREFRGMGERLRQGKVGKKIVLSSHWALRPEDLAGILLRVKPHIVHFSGHGTSAGIILEDPSGRHVVAPTSALAELFGIVSKSIQCVVLNACYSQSHAEAIASHVGVVVGTTKAISDEGAIRFAAGFYQAVAFGRDLKTAFELGVNDVRLHNLPDGETPRLVTSPHVDPSKRVVRGDRRPALIAAAVAAVALISILLGIVLRPDGRTTSLHNVALVVDGSASMAESLRGGDRKLEVTAREVEGYVGPLSDTALALRFFGGACSTPPPAEPDVGFDTHNAGDVVAATHERKPSGVANLVDTVLAAIDDFSDPDLYPKGIGSDRLITRVLVITGSRDGCRRDTARVAERALKQRIGLEFTFIGLGVDDPESVTYLNELATAVEGQALFADSPDVLRSYLDALLADDFTVTTNTLTLSVINPVNKTIEAVESAYRGVTEAERIDAASITSLRELVQSGRDALDDTENLFQALRSSNGPLEYRTLWQIDLEQRRLQATELDQLEQLIELLDTRGERFGDAGSEAQATWKEYNAAREQYGKKNDEFVSLQRKFLDSFRMT